MGKWGDRLQQSRRCRPGTSISGAAATIKDSDSGFLQITHEKPQETERKHRKIVSFKTITFGYILVILVTSCSSRVADSYCCTKWFFLTGK